MSRYDATFAVDDPYPEARSAHGPDPILDGVSRAYGGGMAAYARNELGFKTEMTYALLSSQVTGGWDWQGGRLQASAEDDLRTLLAFSPSFRLLIAHGYADMITPYGMTRYALDHLPPDTASRAHSSSIAAATCFISMRNRARRSARTRRRFIARRGNNIFRHSGTPQSGRRVPE